MASPTTFDTDTELSSVNSILGAIGQSPVTALYTNKGEVKSVSITAPAQADLDSSITTDVYTLRTSSGTNATGLEIKITILVVDPLEYTFEVVKTGKNYSETDVVSFNLAAFSNWSATVVSLITSNTFVNPEVSFIKHLLDE